MPDWLLTLIGVVLSGSLLANAAQLVRARSQNKTDERSQLTNEQSQFRTAMAGELARLSTKIEHLEAANSKLDDRNDELVRENGDLKGRVRYLEEQNADLKNKVMNQDAEKQTMQREIDMLRSSVRGLERRESVAA